MTFSNIITEINTIRKREIDKMISELKFENSSNNKEYEIVTICNSTIYANKSKCYYQSLYYKD